MLKSVRAKAQQWLGSEFDKDTQNAVKHMLDSDEKELIESFYKDLSPCTPKARC